jgi:hypothetical protein
MTTPNKYARRYNWEKIFGRKSSVLRRGVDYNGLDNSFAVHVRLAAKRYGYRVSVSLGEGCVKITVNGKKRPVKGAFNNRSRENRNGSQG